MTGGPTTEWIDRIEAQLARFRDGADVGDAVVGWPAEARRCLDDLIAAEGALFEPTVSPVIEIARPPADRGRLVGPYRLIELLGRGGQGDVYLAQDTRLTRRVALKLLPPGRVDSERLERFRREAELASRLDDPRICTVFESGLVDGAAYIAMRHVPGETLARRLARCATRAPDDPERVADALAPPEAAALIADVARAVHLAHEAGVIHRDLKPANIMISGAGRPVVLDFGLALAVDAELPALTRDGASVGTPAYMAPEQIVSGSRRPGRGVDVWALGVTLYEVLAGRRPFEGGGRHELEGAILGAEPASLARPGHGMSRDLDAIVSKALDKEPQRRYPTTLALAEDLDRYLRGDAVTARPRSVARRAFGWCRAHPARALAGAALASTGLIATLLFVQGIETRRVRERVAVEARRAEGLRLVAEAQLLAVENPGLALRLALAAADRLESPLLSNTLLRILDEVREERCVPVGLPVAELAVSASGAVAIATPDGVRVVDLERNTVLPLDAPRGARAVAWIGDQRLVVGDESGALVVVDPELGCVATRRGHTEPILAVATVGDLVVSGAADGTARVWRGETLEPVLTFRGHSGAVRDVALSGDGVLAVSGADDGTALVWSVADGALLLTLRHRGPVVGVSFDAAGRRVATASEDNTACVWRVEDGALEARLVGHRSGVHSAAFGGGGTHLVTTSFDQSVRIWPLSPAGPPTVLLGHDAETRAATFVGDGAAVLSAGADGTLRRWRSGRPPGVVAVRHDGPVITGRLVPEVGLWLTLAGGRVFARAMGEDAVARVIAGDRPITGLATSGADALLATAERGGVVRSWDLGAGLTVWSARVPEAEEGEVFVVERSPRGDRLLVAGSAGHGALLDSRSGAIIAALEGACEEALPLQSSPPRSFSADGDLVVTTSLDRRSALVWSARDGTPVARHDAADLADVRFAPRGRRVLLAAGLVGRIWSLADDAIVTLSGHAEQVRSIDLTPDGRTAVTASSDRTARLWDADNGALRHVLRGHGHLLYSASFDGAGRRVVTTSWDRTVRLWNAESGALELVQDAHGDTVLYTELAADGRLALSVDLDGGARLWPTDPVAFARELWRGGLTGAETARFGIDGE